MGVLDDCFEWCATFLLLGFQHPCKRVAGLRIRIHFFRIRIQHFRLNTGQDPIQIQGFNDQKFRKKITAEKKFCFWDQKLQFTYP